MRARTPFQQLLFPGWTWVGQLPVNFRSPFIGLPRYSWRDTTKCGAGRICGAARHWSVLITWLIRILSLFSSSLYTTIRNPNLNPNPTVITYPQIGPRDLQIVAVQIRRADPPAWLRILSRAVPGGTLIYWSNILRPAAFPDSNQQMSLAGPCTEYYWILNVYWHVCSKNSWIAEYKIIKRVWSKPIQSTNTIKYKRQNYISLQFSSN